MAYRDKAVHVDEIDVAQQLVEAEEEIRRLKHAERLAEERADYEMRERVRLENEKHARWSEFTETRVALRQTQSLVFKRWLWGLATGFPIGALVERWLFG